MNRIFTEAALKELARDLAPLIAEELGLVPAGGHSFTLSDDYDTETCSAYVENLGDTVLDAAEKFFGALDQSGEIGSLDLTTLVGVARPSVLPFVLTTPLKRRANTLGLQRPWADDVSADDRTIWRDRDGIAQRMVKAIKKEKAHRTARAA